MRRTSSNSTCMIGLAVLALGLAATGPAQGLEPAAAALLASAEPAAPVVLLPGPRLPGAEPEPAAALNDVGVEAFWAETLAMIGGMAEKDEILRDWAADLDDPDRAGWETRLAELARRRADLERRLDGFNADAGGQFGAFWSRFQADMARDRMALDAAYRAALKEMGGTM
ncbi:MAG: hypothetical protein JNK11_05070 [Alphaproteobacteria bacterium]|nr:hypothetical protein [Alphaproteobacteria bacterium]